VEQRESIVEEARHTKALMLRNRLAGEQAFAALLAREPREGLFWLMRGAAYEALGDLGQAAEDYATAMDLLPAGEWRIIAQSAFERVASCRGDTVR
jgi:Flp pilus assembly protein TadD